MSGAVAPVAIVGVGCRFPGADGPAEFWQLIKEGRCAVREVPSHRVELGFNIQDVYDPRPGVRGKISSPRYGFLDHPERFDPIPFGLTPRDAVGMEPQQRLVVEVVWDALQDAGIPPDSLEGERVAVMIGHMAEDYSREQIAVLGEEGYRRSIDVWGAAGIARAAVSGRVSFLLGVRGPSFTVDTACSSSLLTVHLACQSLWAGESSMAIAGGVNLFLSPEGMIALSGVGMLARDGYCKAFDDRADGFVRSEGAGVVVLKPLADALEADDPIYAVIRGTGFSADGKDGGHMMAPGRSGQVQAMRDAYERAAFDPSLIDFVEAHGTGTPIGDPVEIHALDDVMSPGRPADRPLRVSSVKGNIGHAESASGIAGLIKAALAVHHRELPAQLHFETPSRAIPWDELPIRVQTEHAPWPHAGPARAAVNSFGISGTNAHAVLEQPPEAVETKRPTEIDGAGLFVLSAHSPEALHQAADDLGRDVLQRAETGDLSLGDLGYTLARRRGHRSHRLAVVADSAQALSTELLDWSRGEGSRSTSDARCETARAPRIGMVFSGHGAHWVGMGCGLLDRQPVFRAALEEFDAAQRQYVDWSLIDVLRAPAESSLLDRVDVVQSAVTGIAIGLARLWRSLGFEPACVVGHSVGEIAAAHTAGCIDLADAARLACERGRAIRDHATLGAMGVVALPAEAVARELEARAEPVWLAGANAPTASIVSGEVAAVERLLSDLEARGEFARRLNVEYASHCPAMDAPAAALSSATQGLEPRAGDIPFHSTVTGGVIDGRVLGADYWGRNLRAPVLLADAVGSMLEDGVELLLEVSAHPVLAAALGEIAHVKSPDSPVPVIGSLRRDEDEAACILASLGSAFTRGVPVAFAELYPNGRVEPTPLYPYQRQEYWFGAKRGCELAPTSLVFAGLVGTRAQHSFSSSEAGRSSWQIQIDRDAFSKHDQLARAAALQTSELVAMALQAAGQTWPEGAGALEDLKIDEPLWLPDGARLLQVTVDAGEQSARVRIASCPAASAGDVRDWVEHARLRVWRAVPRAGEDAVAPALYLAGSSEDAEGFYERLAALGSGCDIERRCVERLWCGEDELLAAVALPCEESAARAGSAVVRHAVDASLQLARWWASRDAPDERSCASFAGFEEIDLPGAAEAAGELYLRVRPRGGPGFEPEDVVVDVEVFRRDCTQVGTLRGLRLRAHAEAVVREADDPAWVERSLRRLPWPEPATDAPSRWVLTGSDPRLRSDLTRALRAAGSDVVALSDDVLEDPIRSRLAEALAAGAGVIVAGTVPEDAPWLGELLEAESSESSELSESTRVVWRVLRNAVGLGHKDGEVDLDAARAWELAAGRAQRCVDVPEIWTSEQAELLVALLGSNLDAGSLVLRRRELLAPRFVPFERPARKSAAGIASTRGRAFRASAAATTAPGTTEKLDRVDWLVSAADPLAGDEVRIEPRAVGLSFLDVLASAGMSRAGSDELGWECAGVVTEVGAAVTDFAPGDAVFGFARAALASHTTTRAALLVRKPDAIDFAAAAALPLAEVVARHALEGVARLRAGERVVIHSAAGAIGQAALSLALRCGAEVLVTAGSERKRQHLRDMGAQAVLDSRAPQTVRALRDWAGREGIDVVLDLAPANRLADEEALVERMAPGARVVELGRPGLAPRPLRAPGLEYRSIDPVVLLFEKPEELSSLLRDVAAEVAAGTLRAASPTCFPLAQTQRALRYLSQARHLGKVVVTLDASTPARMALASDTSAAWLAEQAVVVWGAGSSSGRAATTWLEAQGARVERFGAGGTPNAWTGLGAAGAVVALDPFAPSAGTELVQALETARNACAAASWAGLEFVWLVTPSEFALPERASEGAAVLASLDAVAAEANALGLPAWRIRLPRSTSVEALKGLEACLGAGGGSVALLGESPGDWARSAAAAHPWFGELRAIADAAGSTECATDSENLGALAPAERLVAVRSELASALGRVLHLGSSVLDQLDWSSAPNDLGLDSLMAVELKLVLETRLQVEVNLAAFFDGTSLSDLAQGLSDRIAERT